MATYYRYECSHTALHHPWRHGDDITMSGICDGCKASRVGEVIEFLRHGTPPQSGHSRNHRDGTPEEGVSVYEIIAGEPQYVGWHFAIAERPAFQGTGRIVGWGSDGEPLVEILTLKKVKVKK